MHLKAKAHQAQGQLPTNKTRPLLPETGVDELAVFGGQTRILVSKILSQQSRRSVQGGSPPVSTSPASSPSAASEDSHTHSDPTPEVHPSLVEYLSMLPPSVSGSTVTSASSVPTQFQFNPTFQSDMFSDLPGITSGPPSQQTFTPTPLSGAFDEHFMRNFANVDFLGASSSSEGVANNFDELERLISGESGMDERWMALMQDVLNPPVS